MILSAFLHMTVSFIEISSEDQQILQDDLNKLAHWEEAWLMKFNVAKCHSMRMTTPFQSRLSMIIPCIIKFQRTFHLQNT